MKIGVIGIGVIGSAVVKGFALDGLHEIYISPRSSTTGTALDLEYTNVTRVSSNQAVVDQSDYVFISVLPKYGFEVLKSLTFRGYHRVINLMSDKKLEDIRKIIGKTESLVHMVPLSFISKGNGPIAIYPKDEAVECLMSSIGRVISVNNPQKIESIAAITGLMTSYYKLMNDVVKWGCDNDLSKEEALEYTTHFFEALAKHAREDDLELLSSEMTPGGINEKALNYIGVEGGFTPWIDILNPLLDKIKK